MPDFLPFAGVRYDQVDVGAVAAPPYDVIDEDERANLEAADPHNSVRLILPRGEEPYAAAADWLARWRAEGVLIVDDQARFYLYEMEYEDEEGRTRHTHGVVGALELGDVLPHERTMPKAKSDRLALLRATLTGPARIES